MTECAWCGNEIPAAELVRYDGAPAHEKCVAFLRRADSVGARGLRFDGVLDAR